ncbi:MAG: transporter substrate-binding domain-containing protein [Campylobacterota bacterium]|nr:transporter substrate-binding domain-containing protein [Campylobacterota bacterium]
MVRILLLLMFCLNPLFSKHLQTIFSYSTPPYVFKDGSGIVYTITKEALQQKKHTVKPIFVNIGRGFEMFKNGQADATSIIKKNSGLKAYYSDYFMQYHNAAFTLKTNKLSINKMEDLGNYYVTAFQNAHKYLGDKFNNAVNKQDKKYTELADQKQQVHMLLKGRTQVAVMDRHIFKFYMNMLIKEKKVPKDIEFTVHELFTPTKYRTAFKDPKIRDDFNKGLKLLKKSGRYDEIYEYYSQKYFKVNK